MASLPGYGDAHVATLGVADKGAMASYVMNLQRTVGNQAAGVLLQRQPTLTKPKPSPKSSSKKLPSMFDLEKMNVTDLKAHQERIRKRRARLDAGDPLADDLLYLLVQIGGELQVREQQPAVDAMRKRLALLKLKGDRAWARLDRLTAKAPADLDFVEGAITSYLARYTEAYENFSKTLGKAKADQARRQAIISAVESVLIGTGLGLGANALFASAKGIQKIAAEAGTEIAELWAGSRMQPQPDVFEPPKAAHPAVQESAAWRNFVQAWKGVALLNSSLVEVGTYRDALGSTMRNLEKSKGRFAGNPLSSLEPQVAGLEKGDAPAQVEAKLDQADTELLRINLGAISPIMNRLSHRLEQDLWIQWMPTATPEAISEVSDRLQAIGVAGGDLSRLGVDFSGLIGPSTRDVRKGVAMAKREESAMQQLGRLGVAITPIDASSGMVRMRHDAYKHSFERDPAPGASEGYYRAKSSSVSVKPGQVVQVWGSGQGELDVHPESSVKHILPVTFEEMGMATLH